MNEHIHHDHDPQDEANRQKGRITWGWWVLAGAAMFYLLAEHRTHVFGVLPYLLLLACPLMHLFMHRGHGHGGHCGHDQKNEKHKNPRGEDRP